MKNKLLAICCVALAFAGCKENDSPIDFGKAIIAGSDSTYVLPTASIPAADPHNVLVEEFTGQSCSNCPSAHQTLESLASGGNVNVVGLYILDPNFTQTSPMPSSKYDFRDMVATDISTQIYGNVAGSGIPSGGVDRVPVNGNRLCYQGDWSGAIASQKLPIDSVNLAVESSYDGTVATIKATITYLKPMATQQNLSIVIVEDTMIDVQEEPYPMDSAAAYVFTNVFRGMVTAAPIGDQILPALTTAKEAGRVYWRKYSYTLPAKNPAINAAHCRVIAFVNTPGLAGDYHVLQSVQCRLK